MSKNMEADLANLNTRHKIRIYAEATAMQRLEKPITTMKKDPTSGVIFPVTENYREFDCGQLVVNYNDLYIAEGDLDHLLKELCNAVKMSMRKKGLIK